MISRMYKDSWKYDFAPGELQDLLDGEEREINGVSHMKVDNPDYVLKFNSFQIENVDCQSGLIKNEEPLFIPFSKIPRLFFLSKRQL